MDKATFIKNQLAKLPIVEWEGDSAKILCPFHDDRNPSLNISLINIPGKISVGGYNCWSCSSHGGWNKLAAKLDLPTWNKEIQENDPDNFFYGLAEDQARLQQRMSKLLYLKPHTEGPWEGSWRGLPGPFLRSIGAESYWDKRAEEYRIYLPLKDLRQNLIGHILARGDNSDIPNSYKYLNSPACPTDKHWFCLNLEATPKIVVVVEGPYDTLRFRYHGIPAIGVLGVGQLTDTKVMQILAKGCSKVILALDADNAGIEALPKYVQKFEGFGFEVIHFNLFNYLAEGQDKLDPGNCPEVAIQDLKNYIKNI